MGKNVHFIEFFYKFLILPGIPKTKVFQFMHKILSIPQYSLIFNTLQ